MFTLAQTIRSIQVRPKPTIRYRSQKQLLGYPLLVIARGPDDNAGERRGIAKGIIAIGDIAFGVVAIGGISAGVISIGGLSLGLFAVGGIAAGGITLGGVAIGLISLGGVGIGILAKGGAAISAWSSTVKPAG